MTDQEMHEHVWVPGCGIDDCESCWLVCDICKISMALNEEGIGWQE